MRRLLTFLAVLALLATACAQQVASEITAADVVEDVDDAVDAAVSESAEEAASTTAPVSVALRTGREAILANATEGKPYVLFYWGAH